MELLEESWRLRDIDVKFIFTAQHYGTAIYALAIVIALGVCHHIMQPKQRSFFVYDATISCRPSGRHAAVLQAVTLLHLCNGQCRRLRLLLGSHIM